MQFINYLGTAGLTDVGFRFFDADGNPTSTRTETGVYEIGRGWYGVNTSVPSNTTFIRWDSTADATAYAIEGKVDERGAVTVDANAIADALLDRANGIESGVTPRQAWRALLATLAGEADGGSTTLITFRNPAGTADRVAMTVDANGNRTSVTLL